MLSAAFIIPAEKSVKSPYHNAGIDVGGWYGFVAHIDRELQERTRLYSRHAYGKRKKFLHFYNITYHSYKSKQKPPYEKGIYILKLHGRLSSGHE